MTGFLKQGISLVGGGVGSAAPNNPPIMDQISLNSPKYMQYINQGAGNNINILNQAQMGAARGGMFIGQNDNSTPSHFNRTGPIVLNNNRPSLQTQVNNLQMYHQMGGRPVSTKNQLYNERMDMGADFHRTHTSKGESQVKRTSSTTNKQSTRAKSNGQQRQPSSSQQMGPAKAGSGGLIQLKMSKKQQSTTLDSN
jgi:hypothetical protein